MQSNINHYSEEENTKAFFEYIHYLDGQLQNLSKEDLQHLQDIIRKQKIQELENKPSKEEKQLREDYLRKLYSGKIQGPIQWNPYDFPIGTYPEKPIRELNPNKSLFENYRDYAKNHLDEMAVYIYRTEKTYTHREILDLIEVYACGLEKEGIEKGDVVAVMLDGSIEEIVMPFAINKIGGIFKLADYSKKEEVVRHSLLDSNVKLSLIENHILQFPPFKNMFEKIIEESAGPMYVVGLIGKPKHKEKKIYELKELGKERKSRTVHYDINDIVCINNSSGTSNGIPKPIAQSSGTLTAALQKLYYTDFPIGSGNVTIKCIPGFVGLGTITSMLSPFLAGGIVALIGSNGGVTLDELKYKMKNFVDKFDIFIKENNLDKDAKINLFVAPEFARDFERDKRIKNLEHIGTFMVAGSSMKDAGEVSEKQRKRGLRVNIVEWYGQNENLGVTGSMNHSMAYPEIVAEGHPLKDVELIIVDNNTHEVLPIGEVGLILERAPSVFKYYPGLPEKTESVRIELNGDEEKWYKPGDYGKINFDGRLQLIDREEQYRIWDDFKTPTVNIENIIQKMPFVRACGIIKTTGKGTSFEDIAAFIEVEEGNDTNSIIEGIYNSPSLDGHQQVQEVFIVKMPYNGSGKIDKAKLKEYYENQNKEKESIKVKK